MEIRLANEKDLLKLWQETEESMESTTRFFYNNIKNGNAEFWTCNSNDQIVGELYVFKKLSDNEFADGIYTAYLCAFRIIKGLRGQGFGTKLLNTVLVHIKDIGFKTATIGVDENETDNMRLYKKAGFTEKVKNSFVDPCNVDENQIPNSCEKFWLLRKSL
jgi:ribosomal protein S18 acetylase RimI-like enzyme